MRSLALVPILCVLVFAGTTAAQITLSYDPLSPEAAAGDPAQMESYSLSCTESVPWTAAALGFPAGGNLDAFSVGEDIFPVFGPAAGGAAFLAPCNMTQAYVIAQFSVDRDTFGIVNGPIFAEAVLGADGCASDTFGVELVFGLGGIMHMTDGACAASSRSAAGGPSRSSEASCT